MAIPQKLNCAVPCGAYIVIRCYTVLYPAKRSYTTLCVLKNAATVDPYTELDAAMRCHTLLYGATRCCMLVDAARRPYTLLYADIRCYALLYAARRC